VSEHAAFPVALNLNGKSVLMIGGSEEAASKLPKLVAAGAVVKVVAEALEPNLAQQRGDHPFEWCARAFQESDLEGVHWVLITEPDEALARMLRGLKDRYPFWLCAIDQPTFSDVFLVSTVARGPVQFSISTSGRAPLLARVLRRAIERGFDDRFSEFARKFAELRERLRALPKTDRKQRLEAALNGFAIEVSVRYPAEALPPAVPPSIPDGR
jgi:siroheme synthase-like protein